MLLMKTFNHFFTNYFFVALLGLLLILAYGHALNFPFQFDDYNVIVDQPKVHSLSAWWQSMPGIRPLLKLTYALNWQLDQSPRFFRLLNLICHFFTSLLVWRLSLALLPDLLKNSTQHHQIAALAALLFALHPAHTEAVTYICGRSTALSALFCMASLLLFLKAKSNQKLAYFVAALVLWLLAVMVKEIAVILPAIVILIGWFTGSGNFFSQKIKSLCVAALAVATFIYLYTLPQYQRLLQQIFDTQSLAHQFFSQPAAHVHYLTQTLFGLNLNIDYAPASANTIYNLPCLAGLILLGYSAFRFREKYALFSFAVFWWFIFLAPTNSFIPRLDWVNDRQIYLASIAPILFFSANVIVFSEKINQIKWMPKTVFILILLGATWLRNWDYESEVTLWQSSVRQQANNARAWNNLGYAYLQLHQKQEAVKALENALELNPDYHKAFYNLKLARDLP
jgi:protein O-mannosyl-transferase